ncbi:lipopolysaccharide transport system ATP-binding protein [Jejuia pallidilutea]|uniref:Lipopolysaccharide transport system ATP-binding protein n=1 Tax=Jejuia pallidilutea TaxID=504487 RepID=A0A362XAC7_9FLAO|nr:ABC transporter ATP-binding protein [Jejuia pallidilutea]PQV47271.1 lipopolysaccharide transport system ATP-binding protein [Jejuia pallidilutea]
MTDIILKAENISKQYRLGLVGTGTISHDLNRWWYRIRGKEDPYLKVGESNDRSAKGNSDYVWALQDINFEVKRGEVLGIIGKNGAGKSTLLKILSKVTSPTTGEIKTRGRIASLLEVGTGFHGEMTGRENIYLNGAILGMTKKEVSSKIEEIIEFSGCQRYIDTPVKRYSSGMTVRLAFAVAAFLEPEILVVDEVLAVGDTEFQAKAIGKMQDISRGDGRTVLFVSHNMASVKKLCTKGVVLENGKIVFSGDSNSAVNYYLNSNYELTEVSLLNRKERKGNFKLKVENIFIEDGEGKKVNEVLTGESYKLVFEYTKFSTIDEKQFTIVLQFKNENDEIVNSIATDELGTSFAKIYDKGRIEIVIPKLQFREGNYFMNYMISERVSLSTPHKVIDYLADAFLMKVNKGDYWKTGVLNRAKGFIQEASIHIT